jgi:hypothetical protein
MGLRSSYLRWTKRGPPPERRTSSGAARSGYWSIEISLLSSRCPCPASLIYSRLKEGGLTRTRCGCRRSSCTVLVILPPESQHPTPGLYTHLAAGRVFVKFERTPSSFRCPPIMRIKSSCPRLTKGGSRPSEGLAAVRLGPGTGGPVIAAFISLPRI